MNIKRIGLIGGGTNTGTGGNTGDNIWNMVVGSSVGVYKEGFAISLGSQVNIGSDGPVFIGSNVYIDAGFDSRNIGGGGNAEDALWNYNDDEGASIKTDHVKIELGTHVRIGTNTMVQVGKHIGIIVGEDGYDESIFVGTNVYIETGFDSRNISGGGGSGDSLWKIENNYLISESGDRRIVLGTRISIGIDNYTEIGEHGIIISNGSSDKLIIGSNVTICEERGEFLTIGSGGISVYDDYGNNTVVNIHDKVNISFNVTIKDNVFIQKGFDTRNLIDLDNNLLPERIPTDSSLNNTSRLSVNIEPQANGNIKIGESLFMPATPSGDPLHYAYEAAGAEYNNTSNFIVKDTPWKDMVDTIEDKAKWGFDVVDASQVKQMTIKGVIYNYVQTTRLSPHSTTEPKYFLVGQASDGTWVEDETKVLHLPGHWYLNGLGDITNTEMRRIYNTGSFLDIVGWGANNGTSIIRTNLITNGNYNQPITSNLILYSNTTIETFRLKGSSFDGVSNTFAQGATKLKHISTNIKGEFRPTFIFNSLKTIKFGNLTKSITINAFFLSKPSIIYAIFNATPTIAISITLHADAYARLATDTDIVAALEAKNAALEGTGGSISLVSA